MPKHSSHCFAVLIATLGLTACTNSSEDLHQQYVYQDRNSQQQCVEQLVIIRENTGPKYYDEDGEPVYGDILANETLKCSTLPPLSPPLDERKKPQQVESSDTPNYLIQTLNSST